MRFMIPNIQLITRFKKKNRGLVLKSSIIMFYQGIEKFMSTPENPLLQFDQLPRFSRIEAIHIEPAIDDLLARGRKNIETVLQAKEAYSWDTLVQLIDDQENFLNKAWSPVSHLNSVLNSESLREAYNNCLPKLTAYATEFGQNVKLHDAYKSVQADPSYAHLLPEQRQQIENLLRDFRLSGVDLGAEDKKQFAEYSQELSKLCTRFEENLLDATDAWEKLVDERNALKGVPDSSLEMFSAAATAKDQTGWLLTLQFPSYFAILTYAEDRELREEVYRAYTTRASDLGDNRSLDNTLVIEEILATRLAQSKLLGFETFAHRSIDTKMADSPDQVLTFLSELVERSKPLAESELDELKSFAASDLGLNDVQAWDINFVSEKLRQKHYDISQEDLKPYFPVDEVLKGLFALVEKLYEVKITTVDNPEVWHQDVSFYRITEPDGVVRGEFYLDLYARENKRGGAWMDSCQNRMRQGNGELQIPVAYMTCNSSAPVGDKPALFTHDEVITLFHEFGHGLHHMLTKVSASGVSGINGVEWDAVELPSQFMENWCWQRESLNMFAAHFETGEKIPDLLFEKMLASKNFQSALQMLRQLEFSIFDLRLHLEFEPGKKDQVSEILSQVRDQVSVVEVPAFNRFQHGFSHIFAGGYAAGYYSYKWAEVLSADAFARFEEEGIFNPEVGKDFLTNILESGGARPAIDSFRGFRGRDPDIKALLRHSNLLVNAER